MTSKLRLRAGARIAPSSSVGAAARWPALQKQDLESYYCGEGSAFGDRNFDVGGWIDLLTFGLPTRRRIDT
jgi:hypothetical protein